MNFRELTLPTKQELDAIDFSWTQNEFKECPERAFVDAPAGVEHYRLLYWLTHEVIENAVELGTYMGFGAYCLARNLETEVLTYDVGAAPVKWKHQPPNLKMLRVMGEDEFPVSIRLYEFIFVDTWHNGIMEEAVFKYLHMHNWKGILMYDDIYYNKEMRAFWDLIKDMASPTIEVIDATDIGHATGTGIIIFK